MRRIALRGLRCGVLVSLLVVALCTTGVWAGASLALAAEAGSPSQTARPTVEVWTDRGDSGTYRQGDPILLFFRVGEDSYVHLFNVNAEGRVKQVFPNEWDRDSCARRGRLYAIPARGTYRFMAGPPFGTERLVAVATPDALAPGVTANLTLEPVSDVNELVARIEAALAVLPREKWNLAVTTLLIRP